VFIVSDGFCRDVLSSTKSSGDRCTVTRYVYELMRCEFVDNGCRHYRSVPVLLPRIDQANIPMWFKNTYLYVWPKQYEKLFKIFHRRNEKLRHRVQ